MCVQFKIISFSFYIASGNTTLQQQLIHKLDLILLNISIKIIGKNNCREPNTSTKFHTPNRLSPRSFSASNFVAKGLNSHVRWEWFLICDYQSHPYLMLKSSNVVQITSV